MSKSLTISSTSKWLGADATWKGIKVSYWAIAFLAIFHIVGIVGFSVPVLIPIFSVLVPFHLLLTVTVMFWELYRTDGIHKSFIFGAFAIAFLGYLVEVVGVNTGLIFGTYKYGPVLGFKLIETPPMIGINWLMLIYAGWNVLNQALPTVSKWVLIPLNALLVTMVDVLIEPVAVEYNFWRWADNFIPFQNYFAWFITALVLSSLVHISVKKPNNIVASSVLLMQVLFFTTLLLRLIIVK